MSATVDTDLGRMFPGPITIPGLEWQIHAYGLLIGLALIVGWVMSLQLADADRLPIKPLSTIYVLGAAVGIFTSRAAWLVQHPDRYEGWSSVLTLPAGGLAAFAGMVAALVVVAVLVDRRRIPVLAWFDCVAPAFATGVVLERLAAFMAGSSFGRYAGPDFFLGVRFPKGSVVYAFHRQHMEALLPAGSNTSLPVHPVQLYGAVLGVLGVALCVWLRRRRTFSGQVFLGFAAYHVVVRALIEEAFRADAPPATVGPLSPGQVAAVVVAGALLAVSRSMLKRARKNPERYARWRGGPWTPKDRRPTNGESVSRAHRGAAAGSKGRARARKGKRG